MSRRRFRVLAGLMILLITVGGIFALWGLLTSVGLYSDGSVFQPEDWQRLQTVHDQLAQSQAAPQAVELLASALLEPRSGDDAEAAAYVRSALIHLDEALEQTSEQQPGHNTLQWAIRELRLLLALAVPTQDPSYHSFDLIPTIELLLPTP